MPKIRTFKNRKPTTFFAKKSNPELPGPTCTKQLGQYTALM